MRKRNYYAIRISDQSAPQRVSQREFHARLSVGAIYRPDQRKPKFARVSPGYRAWVEDGTLCLRRWHPWQVWQWMLAAKIRTNAEIIEQLAILAVWTKWDSEIDRQRLAALQYCD